MLMIQFIRGFLMALADSVPGVSGGTIAFILGFYDKFIQSINDLISGSKEDRLIAFKFLLKIGIGWIVGLVLSILFIASIFEEHIYSISSVFLGLIIVSIPFIINDEKDTLKNDSKSFYFIFIGILVVFLITYFNPISGNGTDGSYENITFVLALTVLLAGMIAISAMVLPGISGSTILLIMGLYGTIINSIKEVLHFNMAYVPIMIIFGIGVIAGAFITIKGVRFTLTNYRSKTIYMIIGLMLGSIYAVIEGPKSLEIPKASLSFSTFCVFYFILGGLIIVGLNYLRGYLETKR